MLFFWVPEVEKLRVSGEVEHAVSFGSHVRLHGVGGALGDAAEEALVVMENDDGEIAEERSWVCQAVWRGDEETVDRSHVMYIPSKGRRSQGAEETLRWRDTSTIMLL